MFFAHSLIQGETILFACLAILLSFGGICIWWFFFSHFSSPLTTPPQALRLSFISGIIAMIAAFFIEKLIFSLVNVDSVLYAFAATAFVEETIKFFILKKQLETHNVDQVIDGMKLGLWIGFGFAFAENASYFFNFFSADYSMSVLVFVIFVRSILATLAHGLYGVVMGYFMSLARFHALYRPRFLRISFFTSILIHGFFNLFLISSLGVWSVLLMAVFLIIVLTWYNDRRNIEVNIDTAFATRKDPPFLAIEHELEAIFSKNNAPLSVFARLLQWFPHSKS